jgi:CBS domain-containing protein
MDKPVIYVDANGDLVEAIRLTKENADVVAHWCGGRGVRTFDAVPVEGDEGQVGINFNGRHETERASEGEYLYREPWQPWYVKLDADSFLAKYSRA